MAKWVENVRLAEWVRTNVFLAARASTTVLIVVCGAASAGAQVSEASREGARLEPHPIAEDGSAVTEWNATALQLLSPATFSSTRILAMTHLAIYDSVMAITQDHEPYAVALKAPHDTSANAAVAAAAHRVLTNQVPAQAAGFDSAYEAALAGIPDGAAKINGIALGELVAARILLLRSGDVLGPPTSPSRKRPGSGNRLGTATTRAWQPPRGRR